MLSVFFISFPGCGTWSGNPPGKSNPPASNLSAVNLSIKAVEPLSAMRSMGSPRLASSSLSIIGASGQPIGVLELKRALVAVQDIRFRLDGTDSEVRERFRGPYAIDLLTGEASPALGSIQLAEATYRDASLEIRKLDDKLSALTQSDSALLDRSLFIEAVFKPINGGEISLTMASDFNETLSIPPAKDGATINAGVRNDVLIAFRLAKWFDFTGQRYDFTSLAGSSAVLDERSEGVEKQLLDGIVRNIKASADFAVTGR